MLILLRPLLILQAFHLHQQLKEATVHLEEWKKSEEETPQQEQERLLHQVKADNQEISSVEKRYRLPLTHTNLTSGLPLQNKGEVGIL